MGVCFYNLFCVCIDHWQGALEIIEIVISKLHYHIETGVGCFVNLCRFWDHKFEINY